MGEQARWREDGQTASYDNRDTGLRHEPSSPRRRSEATMVMRSTLVSERQGAFRTAVLAAACAFAAPAFAQVDNKMTPIDIPDQPRAIEIGTGPLPGAMAQESWHLPVWQSVRPQCDRGDDHAVPARPGQGQRRRCRRCSRRRLPNPVDGERRLECRKRAGRALRCGLRPQVPAEPVSGGHGRIRTLDGRDVLGHRAAASAPRSAADDGRPRSTDRRLARRLRADPAPRRRVEDRSGPHRHGRFFLRAQC